MVATPSHAISDTMPISHAVSIVTPLSRHHPYRRVAEERGESLGATVGYQIRLESRRSEDTRLLFW